MDELPIPVIKVELVGKASFTYSCMQTRLMGQYYILTD